MFGWFKDKRDRKPTLADLPAEVQLLGGLLKGKQHAENLLRMGRDQDAVKQLQMMTPAAIRALGTAKVNDDLFSQIVRLADLLLQTRQTLLAKQLLTPLANTAKALGGNAPPIVEGLLAKMHAIAGSASVASSEGISVVYVCQHCGWLNRFVTEPCMKCGFVARDEGAMRLAVFLSNQYLDIKYLAALGYEIARGKKPKDLLPDFEKNLSKASIPTSNLKTLIGNVNAKGRSSTYPSIESLPRCGKCGSMMKLSNDAACQSCGQELRFPALHRFAIATSRAAESTQRMLTPKDSPAFGRLVCMLVMFEANAFQEGKVPTEAERRDALASMCALQYLDTRDGAMRVIFDAKDVEIGLNQNPTKQQFTESDLMMLFGEWIAFHKYMRKGVPLR